MDRKRILAIILVFILGIFVVACSDNTDNEESKVSKKDTEVKNDTADVEAVSTVPEEDSQTDKEVVKMEGEYANILSDLDTPFDSEKWELDNYQEAEGEATAEFVKVGDGNYAELLTVHYYEGQDPPISADDFMNRMEDKLTETVTGTLDFNILEVSEGEGVYVFSVVEDGEQPDQEELARVFEKEGDLFIIRYTSMEQTIDDKDAWIEKLKKVK